MPLDGWNIALVLCLFRARDEAAILGCKNEAKHTTHQCWSQEPLCTYGVNPARFR